MSKVYGYEEEEPYVLFYEGNSIPDGIFEGIDNSEYWQWEMSGGYDSMSNAGYARYAPSAGKITFYKRTPYNNGILDWDTPLKQHSTTYTEADIEQWCDDVYYLDDMHERYCKITQTLFNSDKDYEILMPICTESKTPIIKEIRGSDWRAITYTYEGKDGEATASTRDWNEEIYPIEVLGIAVVSLRTGATVATFDFPTPTLITDEYYHSLGADIIGMGDKVYLRTVSEVSDDERQYNFYAIEPGMSGVQTPVISKRVSVKPSIVNRGEDVMVSVDGNDAISAITLTGMNGQTLQHIKGNGAKSAAVKTGRLGSGVHIVGVQTTDGENTYNKIVVK